MSSPLDKSSYHLCNSNTFATLVFLSSLAIRPMIERLVILLYHHQCQWLTYCSPHKDHGGVTHLCLWRLHILPVGLHLHSWKDFFWFECIDKIWKVKVELKVSKNLRVTKRFLLVWVTCKVKVEVKWSENLGVTSQHCRARNPVVDKTKESLKIKFDDCKVCFSWWRWSWTWLLLFMPSLGPISPTITPSRGWWVSGSLSYKK